MALAAGTNIGPYRIIEAVGRGGMASVYKAYEASLDRYVALKVLPPEFLHDPNFAARFRREAQTVARLEHPQIIPIFAYDIDTETGTPWMAMRLIGGGSLSQRIKRGRLPASECARILKDVADALDYAHEAGVIHRDVKPQNVLLDDAGRVYLADFGIAKMVEASAHLTQTGMITGTPQYMAPEQALGSNVNKSVDIYALGIVAYELFTGRVPFSADTPVAVLMKQASEPMPLPPVSEVREEVTRAILRATAKDAENRWPTASAFAGAVVAATRADAGTAAPTAMMPTGSEQDVPTVATEARNQPAGGGSRGGGAARTPAQTSPASADPKRRAGMGIALAAVVIFGLALMAGLTAYVGYQYLRSTEKPESTPVVGANLPSPDPNLPETAIPSTPEAPAAESEPEPSPVATTPAAPPPSDLPESRPEALTPAERRQVLLARDPENRRERLEALAAARRRAGQTPQRPDPTEAPPVTQPATAPPRATRTTIKLEVEASQPSTGAQIGALYAQVVIDNRPVRDFTIRFTGGNSFARWKRVETVVLDDVPLSAREILLVVATDPGLNSDRLEGSTRLSLEGEETNLSAVVRFYNQFDKSVRFR